MIIPVRCFSCGKPISHLWEEYTQRVEKGEEKKQVMKDLGLDRYCCKAIFLGHTNLIDIVAQFKRA